MKARKESDPRPSQSWSKSKGCEAQGGSAERCPREEENEELHAIPPRQPEMPLPQRPAEHLGRALPAETRLTATLSPGSAWPLCQPWRSGQHPHAHCRREASQHWLGQAVRKLYDPDMAKVDILIRPDGEQKPYVPLVTMTLWMLPTKLGSSKWESSWLILHIKFSP